LKTTFYLIPTIGVIISGESLGVAFLWLNFSITYKM
jgi:hypothetical protein